MTERAPFNPWENPQDKLIADYNTISNQSGAVIICSDALLCDGLETILQEACQEDSRLQSPDILLSGIGVLSASKNPEGKQGVAHIIQCLLKNGTAAKGRIRVLCNVDAGETPTSEENELRSFVFANHRKYKQVVVSQNQKFLKELRQLCKADTAASQSLPALVTLSVSDSGQLYNPFDSAYSCEAERIADEKHTSLAQRSVMFIDLSALKHPQAKEYLHINKAAMLKTSSQLNVLVYKEQPLPHADLLIDRAQETPATVRFIYLNRNLPTADAIVEALIREESHLAGKAISLITDKATIGARIISQLGHTAIKLSVFSINRHGYLSNIDRSIILQSRPIGSLPSIKREELVAAMESGDEDRVLRIARDARFGRDALEFGIITALRQGKDEYLEKLIKLADACSPIALNWWILDYSGFRNPAYLEENTTHFVLLKELIGKTVRKHGYQLPLEHLKELNAVPSAAHEKFEELIALMETDSPKPRKKRKANAEEQTPEIESPVQAAWSFLMKMSVPGLVVDPEDRLRYIIGMAFLKRVHDCPELDSPSIELRETRQIAFDAMVKEDAKPEAIKSFINGFSPRIKAIADLLGLEYLASRARVDEARFYKHVSETLASSMGDFSTARFNNAEFYDFLTTLIRCKAETSYRLGFFYSNPDLSYLLADLLVSKQSTVESGENIRVCDMTVGSSGMLNVLAEKVQSATNATVTTYGQDSHPSNVAESKMLAMLSGQYPENFSLGDTYREDFAPGTNFRYIVGEPPILRLKRDQVRELPGYPMTTDSTMFILMAGLSKLDAQGKMAIIQPGRSLFETGNNEVRRYLIENDLLEAIVQLPSRMGIGSSIPLYVWIVNKDKEESRRGKLLLIDASRCGGEMRKAKAGVVRSRVLPEEGRQLILQAYSAFEDNGKYVGASKLSCISRVLANSELGHREISVKYTTSNGEEESRTFSMSLNESPDVFLAREILPAHPDAKLDKRRIRDFYDIQMNRYFYVVPEGETPEGSIMHKITVLNKRIAELKEELEARTRHYREQIETNQEELDSLLAIAAHMPGLALDMPKRPILR